MLPQPSNAVTLKVMLPAPTGTTNGTWNGPDVRLTSRSLVADWKRTSVTAPLSVAFATT